MANTVAYGFTGLTDLYSQRVAQVGVARVWDAIRTSASEYNRVLNGVLGQMVERTTLAMEQIELPGSGTLQPLDEWGNPLPVQPGGMYQVAYPIRGGGTGWGGNRVSNAMMTVEEVNRNTLDAFRRDTDWVLRHLMASILNNTTWTFNDKVGGNGAKGLGNITIQPLANGDTVTYVKTGGSVATDDHYLATANAIADATNPFPTLYSELMEHPSNSGPVVVYAPTNLVASIEALETFIPEGDPDILVGVGKSRISAVMDRGFADRVLGKVANCWVMEWGRLPSSYLLAHAAGNPVVGMREYPAPELQGLFHETHSADGNTTEDRLIRYAGFGVRNRVAAAVMRIGNGSWATPTDYVPPLAV